MIECSVERGKVIRRRAEGSPESLITPVKKGAVDKSSDWRGRVKDWPAGQSIGLEEAARN